MKIKKTLVKERNSISKHPLLSLNSSMIKIQKQDVKQN